MDAGRLPLPDQMAYDRKALLCCLECAGSILEVGRLKTYTYAELEEEIVRRREVEEGSLAEHLSHEKESLSAIAAALRQAIAEKKFDHCPYYYWRLADELLPRRTARVVKKALMGVFRELPAGLAYLGLYPAPEDT
jgi:hypothetical protein